MDFYMVWYFKDGGKVSFEGFTQFSAALERKQKLLDEGYISGITMLHI